MSRGWHVPPVAPEDRLYTAGEAARRLQITVKTLTRQADAGLIPHTRTLGLGNGKGHRRYRAAVIERLAAEGRDEMPTNTNQT